MALHTRLNTPSGRTLSSINTAIALVAIVIVGAVIIASRTQSTNMLWVASYDDCVKAGYPIQETYPERCQTPDGKVFVNPTSQVQPVSVATTSTTTVISTTSVPVKNVQPVSQKPVTQPVKKPTPAPYPPQLSPGSCFVGGCSNQICSDEPGAISTCEWREEYACYSKARCERQAAGQCGWTLTPEFQSCWQSSGPQMLE